MKSLKRFRLLTVLFAFFFAATLNAQPTITVNPLSFNVALNCNDSVTLPLTITNTGSGDLEFTTNGSALDTVNVLALTYGVDYFNEYANTINSINQYFTNYTLMEVYTTNASQLQAALIGINILLMAEPETGTPSVYSGFASVLQTFVSNGGTVIMCGAGTGNPSTCLFNTGLITGNYFGTATGLALNVINPTHALVNQVSATPTGTNSTYVLNITNGDRIPVITYNGEDVVCYRSIGMGKVIYIGFDYTAISTDASHIIANAIGWSATGALAPWITLSSTGDTLNAGDSTVIDVTFNSTGLIAGVYTADITVNSNDTANPQIIVPCTLTVSGFPEIALSDTCINFGTIPQNTSITDSVLISNNGCDTLFITSISSSDPVFVPSSGALAVLPYTSVYLKITFTPTGTATFTGTLTLLNNDQDTTICLNGGGAAAPEISVNPTAFNVTLNCNDSITLPLTIYNTGGLPLIVQINGTNAATGTAEVLALTYGVDYPQEYTNTLNAINTNFTNYNLTEINTTSAATLQTALTGKNIFLMAEPETGTPSVYTGFATVLQNFVSSGGIAILCGAYSTQSACIFNTGLLSGMYVDDADGSTVNVVNPSHPLANGLPASFSGTNGSYVLDITNANIIPVVTYAGNELVAYRTLGSGKIIYVGFDYYSTSTEVSRVIANAMEWAATGVLPQWLDVDSVNASIPPGDSIVVNVTFNSSGLIAGVYTGSIDILSNDPSDSLITIPCTLTVVGDPSIALSDTCIAFGSIISNTSITDSITVVNNGCDTLLISSIVPATAEYSATPSSLAIAPYDTAKIYVTFSPTSVGTFNSTITIFNNDQDTTICVSGTALPAPQIIVVPMSFNVTLGCRDSITLPLTVYNIGGSDLYCDIIVSGSGLVGDTSILVIQEVPAWSLDMSTYLQTNFGITPDVITSSQIAATNFMDYDIVITVGGQSTAYYNLISSNQAKFEAFANAGGIIQHQMATFSGNPTVNLAGGVIMTYGNTQNQNTGLLPLHPILAGISNPLQGNNANHGTISNLPVGAQIISETAAAPVGPTTVDYEYGNGRVILTSMPWEHQFVNAYNSGQMLPNSIAYGISNVGSAATWITISSTGDTITPGDSSIFYVTFNSTGMAAGTYYGEILVNSNDPLNPQIIVPCTLTVSNQACPDFSFAGNSCTGTVAFTDLSLNSPTSWAWQFGDGGTSTLQNPTHTYASIGTYLVTLVACNATGCDSITLSVFVPSVSGPIPASCSPATTGWCCAMGITNVEFNTINNTSANGNAGYEDFSCTANTIVTAGQSYLLGVTTGPTYQENVRVWIDYNNDGVFAPATEQVFASTALINHSGNVTIPFSTVLNTPLRMRVGSDYNMNPAPSPCTSVQYGQFEDYSVVVIPSNAPPVALFNINVIDSCTGMVQFFDISQNLPTSWLWDFGDATSSTLQNPSHQYATAGTYSVKLVATNSFGSDSILNSVTVYNIVAQIQFTGVMAVGQPISFTCPTPNATSWNWDFDDGFFSLLQNPVHTYTTAGVYTVTLTVTGPGPCTVQTDTVISIITGIEDVQGNIVFTVAPNPFTEETIIQFALKKEAKVSIELFNTSGELIMKPVADERKSKGVYSIKLNNLSEGIYFIRFRTDETSLIRKIVKME